MLDDEVFNLLVEFYDVISLVRWLLELKRKLRVAFTNLHGDQVLAFEPREFFQGLLEVEHATEELCSDTRVLERVVSIESMGCLICV